MLCVDLEKKAAQAGSGRAGALSFVKRVFPFCGSSDARHGPRKARAPAKRERGRGAGGEGEEAKTAVLGIAPVVPALNVPEV